MLQRLLRFVTDSIGAEVSLIGFQINEIMANQMVVNEMSTRIDNLENTIQDLMHADIDGPDLIPPSGSSEVAR